MKKRIKSTHLFKLNVENNVINFFVIIVITTPLSISLFLN